MVEVRKRKAGAQQTPFMGEVGFTLKRQGTPVSEFFVELTQIFFVDFGPVDGCGRQLRNIE